MTARKRGNTWTVDFVFRHPNGRRERIRQKSPVNTKAGAEVFERQIRNEMLENPNKRPKDAPTLSDYAETYVRSLAPRVRQSTLMLRARILERDILPVLGSAPLDQIGAPQFSELRQSMSARNLKTSTMKTIETTLRALLSVARSDGFQTQDQRVPRLRVPDAPFDYLSFEEAERLLVTARGEPALDLAVHIAVLAGLRIGEILGLQWQDIDLSEDAPSLRVRRQQTILGGIAPTKSGRERVLPMSAALVDAFRRAERGIGAASILPSCVKWTHQLSGWRLGRLVEKAGIHRETGKIGWHDLRHTFASHLAMRGVNEVKIMMLMGHSNVSMTLRYTHLSDASLREAVATQSQMAL